MRSNFKCQIRLCINKSITFRHSRLLFYILHHTCQANIKFITLIYCFHSSWHWLLSIVSKIILDILNLRLCFCVFPCSCSKSPPSFNTFTEIFFSCFKLYLYLAHATNKMLKNMARGDPQVI